MAAQHASAWPEDPYPGTWPDHSYVVDADALVHPVVPGEGDWLVGADRIELDAWLSERGLPGLSERDAVLSFGSNRCPSKVVRQGGPFVNLVCRTKGLAAVWSHGTRSSDGQVVATLVGADDHEADFFVSLCTDDDIAMLDVVEGRGTGYELLAIDPDLVVLENGESPERIWAYVGLHPHRTPVAGEDGLPVLLTAMNQDEIAIWRERDAVHWVHDPQTPWRPLSVDSAHGRHGRTGRRR